MPKYYYRALLSAMILLSANLALGQKKEVTFNQNYIEKNDHGVAIEINEVQELTYIMFALTQYGLKDSDMVNHNTEYHKSVIDYFSPYANHPSLKLMDSLLNESIIYYLLISANAYGYEFDGDVLMKTNVYDFPAKGVGTFSLKTDPILTYQKEIEDFAQTSKFREFYRSNNSYFKEIVKDYVEFGAIDKQKEWLEEHFDYRINSYRVLTSPLIGGINATSTFEDNSFKETLLFLPTIKYNKEWSAELNEAMNSRIIFTEIDHNYVGPLSAQYKTRIDSIFDKRNIWVNKENKSTEHYPNPIKVFDEYLTWGLFILYAQDHFPGNDELLQKVVDHVNDKMSTKGFPKSIEFNEELVRLYLASQTKNIEDLYDGLLTWASDQNYSK